VQYNKTIDITGSTTVITIGCKKRLKLANGTIQCVSDCAGYLTSNESDICYEKCTILNTDNTFYVLDESSRSCILFNASACRLLREVSGDYVCVPENENTCKETKAPPEKTYSSANICTDTCANGQYFNENYTGCVSGCDEA